MPLTSGQPLVVKVLQVNLNHCWTAQQLVLQTVAELESDVVIVSDYNRPMGQSDNWVASTDGKCAVFVPNRSTAVISNHGSGDGFAWAMVDSTLLYSCYCTPNCTIQEFDRFLVGLETSIRYQVGAATDIVVAGDFNSHSAEWGSSTEDTRGSLLSGFASGLDLTVCNVGTVPTFRRVNAASVIDVTFARAANNRPLVSDWSVLANRYTASDHEYIAFSVSKAGPRRSPSRVVQPGGWSVKKLSQEAIKEHWDRAGLPPSLSSDASVEDHAEQLQDLLNRACEASMPKRSLPRGRKAVHWWSEDIANLRKSAIAARRSYQRAGRRADTNDREATFAAYNTARKTLRVAIRKAQERSWRELCDSVDNDPWGVPYRLVTKKLVRRTPAMDDQVTLQVARGLFPSLPLVAWDQVPLDPGLSCELELSAADTTPLFTVEELTQAVAKLPSGKAPGPDHIPNEVIKIAAKRHPKTFLETYNACLSGGVFPQRWKKAKLVLLHKGAGKPPDQPSSYRPISLLDGAGKLLERLLLNRLQPHTEMRLCSLQFGFRRFRSTTDAIEEVLKTARAAGSGAVQNRRLCAVVTIDVKNAFNTAPWRLIDEALQRSSVPGYLINIIRSYMSDRELLLGENCTAGESGLPVTCGVPQGSVLGPTLWNMFYDGILRLPVHKDVKLIAFADDVAVVAVAHNVELMEQLVNPVLADIARWMTDNGLTLAPEKSECVVLTGKHCFGTPNLQIQGFSVPVKRDIRYLGVRLDTRLSFAEHATSVAAGAKATAAALGRLMPNVGGPTQCKRRLLMSVVHSRLLYGAPVWAESVQGVKKSEEALLKAQRIAALRVARCYRTVSDMASLVLAKMPPVSLLALSRKKMVESRKSGNVLSKTEATKEVIAKWQAVWDSTGKAAWTKRLIPDLARWWYRGPNQVSFHMAQALTNHGCFQKYLWEKARAQSPACVHCTAEEDDAEHTIFSCPFWVDARGDLTRSLGRPPRPEDVADLLCNPGLDDVPTERHLRARAIAAARRNSILFNEMVEAILGQKEILERTRQNHN